jgi:adenine phosphoribosyltransferase
MSEATANAPLDFRKFIRDVPDFPKKGIMFKDITPLVGDARAFRLAVRTLADRFWNHKIDAVCGVEARGFILGPAIAMELGLGFVPVRKSGKLPYKTHKVKYDLEYGTDSVEVHVDAVKPGQTVLMVDDLLATGGTMEASCRLIESIGAKVGGCAFLVELGFLKGRERLARYGPVVALLGYDGE